MCLINIQSDILNCDNFQLKCNECKCTNTQIGCAYTQNQTKEFEKKNPAD